MVNDAWCVVTAFSLDASHTVLTSSSRPVESIHDRYSTSEQDGSAAESDKVTAVGASPQMMVLCTICKETLPESDFSKGQIKKLKKGKKRRPCVCLGCSGQTGGGNAPVTNVAASSGASSNEVCAGTQHTHDSH